MLYQFAIYMSFFQERRKGKPFFQTDKYLKEKMMKKYHLDILKKQIRLNVIHFDVLYFYRQGQTQ